jgi:hypothetical protein
VCLELESFPLSGVSVDEQGGEEEEATNQTNAYKSKDRGSGVVEVSRTKKSGQVRVRSSALAPKSV